ncbi:helix-turn-helix domain-containing protein [Pseudomonas shirazensis]|uniref:helix-turn-helix domain-containing protein n=1 Tax=Pseudomonas shirazensis TaxID=2745494 RepID=UPI003D28C733
MPLTSETLPASPHFELSWVRAQSAASFPRHTHDEYVIGANLNGQERIWLDGRELEVAPGQVTLYNPLAVQGSEFAATGVEYISLHLAPAAITQTISANNLRSTATAPRLEQGVLQRPQLFAALLELAWAGDEQREQAELLLLAQLLEHPASAAHEQSTAVAISQAFMREHLQQRLALEQLAHVAGLSKYHFVRCFKKATGLGPLQYHMQLRLIEARHRLRLGQHAQDVALDLGFYDQSHFITAFRRVHGVTPQHYAAARMNSR